MYLFINFLCSSFYFVGDEDLLEIIGNSKSVEKLQKHFKKMFAGIAAVQLSEDQNTIYGISSREGEEVRRGWPVVLNLYFFVLPNFVMMYFFVLPNFVMMYIKYIIVCMIPSV